MTYSRVDVDDDFVYTNYSVVRVPVDPSITGYQYVRCLVKTGDRNIGMVEFENGRWIALNDPGTEHRDLVDAVKKCVNAFLNCDKEITAFNSKYATKQVDKDKQDEGVDFLNQCIKSLTPVEEWNIMDVDLMVNLVAVLHVLLNLIFYASGFLILYLIYKYFTSK